MKACGFWFRNLTAYSSIYPWNLISFEYMHSITIKMSAKRISKIPKMIDQGPPRMVEAKEVAKDKMANTNSKMMAKTKDIMGEYLGKQWVRVILNSPNPRAMTNV